MQDFYSAYPSQCFTNSNTENGSKSLPTEVVPAPPLPPPLPYSSTNAEADSQEETTRKMGQSILDKYREVGFLKDASGSALFWDFIACPGRVVRLSIPKQLEGEKAPTNWIHLKT